jgi:Putative prokaryotic signal transducing protein
VTVSDVLIYQTSDPGFAERAVQTLQEAEIPCYHTGTGYAELHPGLNLDLSTGISIYIRNDHDYGRANELLVEIGAAVEEPLRLPSARAGFILLAVVLALAVFVALEWM